MKITNILVNQMEHPLGFDLSNLRITFELTEMENIIGNVYKNISVGKVESEQPIYFEPDELYENNAFKINMELEPRTKYWVKIGVRNDNEVTSSNTWFETGKMDEKFYGKWITNKKDVENTLFKKDFELANKQIKSARLYSTTLGVYEVDLNGVKVGNEFLAPGFTNYDKIVQLQTYDVTKLVTKNSNNELVFSVGDGWYKGNLGFDGGQTNIYGDKKSILAELHVTYTDNSEQVISTDSSWLTTEGKIIKSSIYYGEDIDDTKDILDWSSVVILNKSTSIVRDRLSLPIMKKEVLKVKEIIHTPKNEIVLDFGQNHAGWPVFINRLARGKKITLQMGEILQDGNFYNKNLRLARAAFTYISDGEEKLIRPHFTYFGFRYVKISGVTDVNKDDFESCVLYSDLKQTGFIKTNNDKVNRLFKNVIWGQKSNFMDVPTDCPQRDERLGWTGDAEIFAPTASFNMNTYEFYKKYAKDMLVEQEDNKGMLPIIVPSLKQKSTGMAIWSDAATIIPWVTYRFFDDLGVLKQNYSQMKNWVDWITQNTKTKYLWIGQMQLGDWLSLDNGANPQGKTNEDYIASIYYFVSASIVSKAARLLHYDMESDYYENLARNIKTNILNEFVTEKGRIAIDTQTALVLALHFGLVHDYQKSQVVADLVKKVKDDNKHLQTGFVGTPFLLSVLSNNNQHHLAMDIFMQEDCPSWLYEVNMGATTIWERWNSVLPDGKMNPEGMNSLNHYSFGAVMMWMYQCVVGLNQFDAGFKEIYFAPKFDCRLKDIYSEFDSTYGKIKVEYHLETNEKHLIRMNLVIPFGVKMKVKLPRSAKYLINGKEKIGIVKLEYGKYDISYIPTKSYLNYYDLNSKLVDILDNNDLVKRIDQIDEKILQKVKRMGNTRSIFINKKIDELLDFEEISQEEKNQLVDILHKTIFIKLNLF
ncbi:glycoside hydrolase family 78 protein [Lactobacillus acidophilus]|uniref:glycoside hydrolase family 78 protein n=1 Tax=Lactobacillus acidophilus TaxID=1579 RepID=UPI000354F3CA|nr:glycoside hydrolase family 78 protein [Lactobacillus acidophilus]MCT3628471.1 alfa-L-rhamnosidase [Lactobacillus acidophilus]UEX75810.1 glycoside hydrolase family 78 protein [Lactobacillus acidophilus]UIP48329.1 glycoside hydrolase family 78 protein [Lactobacillus acidophilus]UUY12110.1 glycoside hydrolase family 78 protein [Lactobacillus acidophilus]UYB34227.1 glycoside hydrolase family 78 protein [Lactobacillus acidophilus]